MNEVASFSYDLVLATGKGHSELISWEWLAWDRWSHTYLDLSICLLRGQILGHFWAAS